MKLAFVSNKILTCLALATMLSGCEANFEDSTWLQKGTDHGNVSDTEKDGYLDTDSDQTSPSDDNLTSDSDSALESDPFSDSGTEEEICSQWNVNIKLVPARLMILQDISGSMVWDEYDQPQTPPTKWDQARAALTNLLQNENIELEIGFDTFPNNTSCGVAQPVKADSLPNNSDNIIAKLDTIAPNGGTPLYLAMKNFTKGNYAPRFSSSDATSYLLVVSDGADTCGLSGLPYLPAANATQLKNITARLLNEFQIKTFVIGFGSGADPGQLNAIAAAGGTGRTTYYDVENGHQLELELSKIVSSVASCVYDIEKQDETQVDMQKVNFLFDGQKLAVSPNCAAEDGWKWADAGMTRVEFCAGACKKLQGGLVEQISATFGCHQVIIQ